MTMKYASCIGNVVCIGYTTIMTVLGLYADCNAFIAASMMGIVSVAAVSIMNMYCLHEKEMDEKSRKNAEPFPFCE